VFLVVEMEYVLNKLRQTQEVIVVSYYVDSLSKASIPNYELLEANINTKHSGWVQEINISPFICETNFHPTRFP